VKFVFVQLSPFVADWRKLKLGDDALRALELAIARDPLAGPIMSGTGGLRKIRFAPTESGKGKSGSLRVGYAYFVVNEQIVLVKAFGKSDQANFTPAERNQIRKLLTAYKESLEKDDR
jgi:hypothetical protein